MNPAPNATRSSMTRSSRTARRVTATAPSTLPRAATRAYTSALDTGEQVFLRVARGVFEDLVEQPSERFSDVGTGPNPGGDQVIATHREVLERQRWMLRADCGDRLQELGAGSLRQGQQVFRVIADRRQPAPDRRRILRIRVVVAPFPDRSSPFDILIRAFQPNQQ